MRLIIVVLLAIASVTAAVYFDNRSNQKMAEVEIKTLPNGVEQYRFTDERGRTKCFSTIPGSTKGFTMDCADFGK